MLASFILLMKPGIVAAVLLAGFTGMVMAQRGWPDAWTCLICLACLFLSAAGSAILNCLFDAPLDALMTRSRTRVEAMEKVGKGNLLAMAMAGITASLLLAILCFDTFVFILILAAVISYAFLYTLHLKRRSPWGTVVGGIPGALPVLIGYAAAAHTLRLDAIILFTVMLLWQPPHFWALALEYHSDYRAAGIPVLPVIYGERYTKILIFIYAIAILPVSLSLWLFGFCSAWYAVCAIVCGAVFLTANFLFIIRRERFNLAFRASIVYLTMLFMAIVIDICFFRGALS
jgi:protoheme IX farnesyltransferase